MPDLKIGITAQDKTQKAFGAVNTSLGKMKTAFSGVKSSIVGLVGAAGLGALSKNLLSTADRLDKVSKQTGVTTTNLQKFQFAASQSGVGTEGLNKALQTLAKRTGEVVTEGGEFAETFERLGIELQNVDGTTKDMSEIFLQGAEAVSQLGSDAEKAAAANDLFGRSGMELLPLFSGGAKLINKYGKELETAAGIMNDKFITASAAANDAMDKAGRVLKTAFANILMALLPSLKDFAETLSKFGGAFKSFAEEHPTVAKLAIAVTGLALAFATLGGPFTLIAAGIAALVVGWSALTKAMGGAKEAVKGMGLKQLKEQYSKLDEELKGFNQTFEELEKRDPWEKILRKSGKILVDQARLKKEHKKTMEIVASQIKTLEKQVVTQTKIKKEVTVIAKKSKDLTLHWSRLDKRLKDVTFKNLSDEQKLLIKDALEFLQLEAEMAQILRQQEKEKQKILDLDKESTKALQVQQLTGELNFKTTTKLVKEFSQYDDAITRGVKHNQTLTRETVKQTKQLVKQRKLSQEVPKALFEGIKGAGAGASRFFHAMGIQLKEVGNKMKLTFSTNWLAIITRFAMSSKKVQKFTDKMFSTVGNAVDSLLPDIFTAKKASDEWAKRLAEIEERVGKYRTDINEISRSLKHITPEAQALSKLEEEYAANKEEAQRLESVHLSYLADVNFELSNMKGNVDAMRSATISFTAAITTFLDAVATEGMTMMQKTVFSTLQGFERNVLGTFNTAIGEAQKIIDSPDYKKNLSLSELGDSLEGIKNQYGLGGFKVSGQRVGAIKEIAQNTEAMKLMTSGQQQLFKDLMSGEKVFDFLSGAEQSAVADVIKQMMDVGKETKGPLATQVKLLEEANATIANLTPQVELATKGLKVMVKGIVEGAVKEGQSREEITAQLTSMADVFEKAGLKQADIDEIVSKAISGEKIGGAQGGLFKAFQGGGMVRGRSHLAGGTNANLESGEFVMRKSAVDQYGAGFMDAVNKGQFGGVTVNIYSDVGRKISESEAGIRIAIEDRANRNNQFPALLAA